MKGQIARLVVIAIGLALGMLSLHAATAGNAPKNVVVTPLLSTSVTSSGQPIMLPAKDATVIVSTYEIAAGARLPEHKHPYPRYGYLLAGELRITNTETGHTETYKPGAFIIESIDQWHYAQNVGAGPAKLLVIDQVEHAKDNVVLRK